MDLKSKHFKSIDLKFKSKFMFLNTTFIYFEIIRLGLATLSTFIFILLLTMTNLFDTIYLNY